MDFSLLLPIIILLLFVPIFMSSRKQKRLATEMQALQASLEPGDVVSTTSGLRGTVVDASYEDTIDLEIADGVVTTWIRAAVREKITTDEPTVEPTGPSLTKADPAPVDLAPVDPAPVDPAHLAPTPVDPEPAATATVETAPGDAVVAHSDDSPNGSHRS